MWNNGRVQERKANEKKKWIYITKERNIWFKLNKWFYGDREKPQKLEYFTQANNLWNNLEIALTLAVNQSRYDLTSLFFFDSISSVLRSRKWREKKILSSQYKEDEMNCRFITRFKKLIPWQWMLKREKLVINKTSINVLAKINSRNYLPDRRKRAGICHYT